MKRFLLTVIGNLDSEKKCKDIAVGLTPIVDSPHLKFQHTKGVLIFHFESEVDKSEIYDYVYGITFGIADTFILTEINDNMTVSLPEEMKGHLFDLENSGNDISMNIDMRVVKNNSETNWDEEEDEDFIALLLGQKDNFFTKPSLNSILDKINLKGYESLSQFEKDTLEEYSKK